MQTGTILTERLRRWTREEYDRLVELGLFAGERVELIRGVIVEMSPQSPRHSGTNRRIARALARVLGDRAEIREQYPLAVSDDSEPEPDIAVVQPGDYVDRHPTHAWLVVEVAASSLRDDRDKGEVYAAAGVPDYWIVDVDRDRLERHVDPRDGEYATRTVHGRGDVLELVAFPGARVPVADLLAPPA